MTPEKMHSNETDINIGLVRELVASQMPWAKSLPMCFVPSAGTDNALYRLGDDWVVRLPRIPSAAAQLKKEVRWLPFLRSRLSLSCPSPTLPEVIAVGEPDARFPWIWSVYRWLDGEDASTAEIEDRLPVAVDLAAFIHGLWQIDASDGPAPGEHNAYRGVPLAQRDERTRACIRELTDCIDVAPVMRVWDAALAADNWNAPPVWLHGDLQAGNLLIRRGRISSVVDFGCSGVGDPACDVMAAWLLLDASARQTFRDALQVDDATWMRARGWALSMGVIALPYYRQSNPILAAIAERAIHEALADTVD